MCSVLFGLVYSWLLCTGTRGQNPKLCHSKVLLNSFSMNGHTLGFCPYNQKKAFTRGVKGLKTVYYNN